MSEPEAIAFLAEQRTVTCASLGRGGRPHLMPLWYVPDGLELWCWTYGASQKALNLRRDPRATLQVESGVAYEELRGVMIEADAEVIEAPSRVAEVGLRIALRYTPGEPAPEAVSPELRAFVEAQAPKRVAVRFRPTRTVTWDHRKLAGGY